jgi:hypothetical protein
MVVWLHTKYYEGRSITDAGECEGGRYRFFSPKIEKKIEILPSSLFE